jgi:nucleoside-diphosphate-sugar epimerase
LRAFVTGATGLVGSHIVERLLADGHEVRALVRDSSDTSHLDRLQVEIARGDLRDACGLRKMLAGIDVLFHNAALVSDWGRSSDFNDVAIDGTARLVDAAVRAEVPRFVHMSSAAIYGLRRVRGQVVSEDLPPPRRPWRWDDYGRAKIESEQVVLSRRSDGIGTTILRPTFVYGPRDRAVLPRLAQLLHSGRVALVGSGRNPVHLIYASDVADAALRAGTKPAAVGGIYHLDGPGDITQRALLETLADLVGAPRPSLRLPLHLVYATAFLREAWGRVTGAETPPSRTRYTVALTAGESQFDTSRAQRELGWKPRVGGEQGLQRTVRWWRSAHGISAVSPPSPCSSSPVQPGCG